MAINIRTLVVKGVEIVGIRRGEQTWWGEKRIGSRGNGNRGKSFT